MAKKYNCVKNGVSYFRKTKTIGHRSDGSPIKKEFYGDGEKDTDKQIEKFMNFIKNGVPDDFFNVTIEKLMFIWIFEVLLHARKVAHASLDKHEINYRKYIKNSDIGCLTVYDISSMPIQLYYNKAFEEGLPDRDNKGNDKIDEQGKKQIVKLSSKKIFDINKTLRSFFSWAIKLHYLRENPCSLKIIEIPGDPDEIEEDEEGNDIQVFNDNERDIILKNLQFNEQQNNTFNVSINLDFITGLRQGELIALQKKHFDLNNCTVKVRQTLALVKIFTTPYEYTRKLKQKRTKFPTSIRTVPFPKYFAEILKKYFKEQEIKWKNQGLEFNDDSLVFTTASCKPISARNFIRAWERFLKRIDVQYKKFHSIRDTYATNLIRRGANIHDVKELLGHSSITITEKYYIFLFPEDLHNTVELLSDYNLDVKKDFINESDIENELDNLGRKELFDLIKSYNKYISNFNFNQIEKPKSLYIFYKKRI